MLYAFKDITWESCTKGHLPNERSPFWQMNASRELAVKRKKNGDRKGIKGYAVKFPVHEMARKGILREGDVIDLSDQQKQLDYFRNDDSYADWENEALDNKRKKIQQWPFKLGYQTAFR